eukprot:m.61516 g.61516  ORF g.61516 m.61516 type:complete len:493 (-) comp7343_c0_seq3:2-1480(-)
MRAIGPARGCNCANCISGTNDRWPTPPHHVVASARDASGAAPAMQQLPIQLQTAQQPQQTSQRRIRASACAVAVSRRFSPARTLSLCVKMASAVFFRTTMTSSASARAAGSAAPSWMCLSLSFAPRHPSATARPLWTAKLQVCPYNRRKIGEGISWDFVVALTFLRVLMRLRVLRCGGSVNGEKVEPDHVLRDGDYMVNRVHRHEPPVTDQPIEIIAQNDDYIVVDKPASIPVHPSGRYRHNTILLLLGHEHDIWNISTCHRLDRLTSGLLILAKHKDASRRMEAQISSRSVQKEYISRVEGVFPEEEIVCEQPIKQVSHKLGLSAVHPEGKPCRTTFRRIATNGKESLVRCIPHTGRMHQIRIHLQYLGHPISNDPLYRRSEWGVVDGKGPSAETIERITTAVAASQNHRENEITSVPMSPPDRSDPRYRPNCSDCHSKWPDPTEESLRIYLHAISYAGEGWKYETPLPAWAREFEVAAESKDGNYYDMHN